MPEDDIPEMAMIEKSGGVILQYEAGRLIWEEKRA